MSMDDRSGMLSSIDYMKTNPVVPGYTANPGQQDLRKNSFMDSFLGNGNAFLVSDFGIDML